MKDLHLGSRLETFLLNFCLLISLPSPSCYIALLHAIDNRIFLTPLFCELEDDIWNVSFQRVSQVFICSSLPCGSCCIALLERQSQTMAKLIHHRQPTMLPTIYSLAWGEHTIHCYAIKKHHRINYLNFNSLQCHVTMYMYIAHCIAVTYYDAIKIPPDQLSKS